MELLVEEAASQHIDGAKLFDFTNQYGRLVQLGTENRKLKVTFQWDKKNYLRRYEIVEQFIQALNSMKREPVA
jgi:transcription-repair coupling factor (superfamily II helicase)